MLLRRYVGIFLSLIFSLVALIFSLPIVLGSFFTLLAGRCMCWSQAKHVYESSQALLGIRLDDMRCMRCNKLISGKDKTDMTNEIIGLNLALEDFNRGLAAEKLIEETKKKEQN